MYYALLNLCGVFWRLTESASHNKIHASRYYLSCESVNYRCRSYCYSSSSNCSIQLQPIFGSTTADANGAKKNAAATAATANADSADTASTTDAADAEHFQPRFQDDRQLEKRITKRLGILFW